MSLPDQATLYLYCWGLIVLMVVILNGFTLWRVMRLGGLCAEPGRLCWRSCPHYRDCPRIDK